MGVSLDSRIYSRTYVMNEMLFGQSRDQIDLMQQDMNVTLDVNSQNCYILLAGVKRQEYRKWLNMDRAQYLTLFLNLYQFIEQVAKEEDFSFAACSLNYDSSKRIVIILSPNRTRFDPIPSALRISKWMEGQYRRCDMLDNTYFCNVVAVSEQIHSYEQIHPEFKKLMHLHDLAFFHRTSQPLTRQIMSERRIAYSMVEVERMIEEFSNAVYQKDMERSEKLLHELVLGHLKACQDFSFCAEAYFLLRQKVRSMGLVLGVPIHRVDDFPHMQSFVSIEEQFEAMRSFLFECFFPQRRKPGCPGKMSILAVTYINQNYYNPDLGLTDVAKYIHTNTAYLSRVFKKEMGIGVCEYMNRLRVEQAARLLRETNLKVVQVAECVGIGDAHYFSSLFRRRMNTSPSLYRKAHMDRSKTDS